MNKVKYILIVLLCTVSWLSYGQTTLDNFTDGDYTANPVWTIHSGTASATTNSLVFGGGNTGLSISTPLTDDCSVWTFTLKSSGSSNNDNVRFYFVLVNSGNPSNASSDGYCVDYDGSNGNFMLYRLDNGSVTQIGSTWDKTATTSARTVSITMNSSGNIAVTVSGETGSLTATDNTYPATTSEFIAITCNTDDTDASDNFGIDNIVYTSACFNPTSAGVIANAQSSCGSFDPTTLTSSSAASGQTGTLEYKWQSSTTSSVTGFSDIGSSNSTTYDPSTITQTTWYKRLARVTCRADWTGAAESNVIEVTIACNNPTSAGTITNTQVICSGTDASVIGSSADASGAICTIEYKWQSSITSSVTGFSDISGATSTTYDPPALTQTTWYKRLARVTCRANWTGAAESNVIEKTVVSALSINGFPVNDTVYNELGNASFGVSATPTTGISYQWQVSTNGGSSWSNISDGGFYLGVTTSTLQVTNPIYGMDGYLYRCSVTNACGILNSPSATLRVIQVSVFSNTTSTSCGTNFSNTWGTFERTITVTGLPTPLGTSSGQYVLRQVDLQLGSSSCKKILSTYQARIISPNGTIIVLFDNTSGTFTGNSVWINTKFRDHESLERYTQYTTSLQTFYFPYSIGYYAIQNDGDFNNVIGENPNGNWRLQIIENASTGDEISFESVRLHFGPNFSINNITSSTTNDICSNAVCISSQEIVIGTNNSYGSSDPLFPGTTTGTCLWNGANNNSAWFKFVASQSTAYLTLSGIRAVSTAIDDTQPLIFSMTNPCVSGYNVPTGGCPDDEAVNNRSYMSTNGGGIGAAGGVYSNGITANVEFNLSGLTVGQTYYLYVDGTGGASSTFYIEAAFGCQTCNTILPIELSYFDFKCLDGVTQLNWSTQSELNNEYFTVMASTDGNEWIEVANIYGAGNSNELRNYQYKIPSSLSDYEYYKLKQTDTDGKYTYSKIIYANCTETDAIDFYPNPFEDVLSFKLNHRDEAVVDVYDNLGQIVYTNKITNSNTQVDLSQLASGVYYLKVNQSKIYKIIKN